MRHGRRCSARIVEPGLELNRDRRGKAGMARSGENRTVRDPDCRSMAWPGQARTGRYGVQADGMTRQG